MRAPGEPVALAMPAREPAVERVQAVREEPALAVPARPAAARQASEPDAAMHPALARA
jgi:hypothetical protein